MSNQTTKTGIFLSETQGKTTWFVVEYDDGSASVHPSWDEAMTAGNFDTNE